MLTIDGSEGEGGGQMLRTSLALALVTGTPFKMVNVRAGRARPGLLRQHLAAVRAAATIGQAKVEGDELNSRALSFWPGSPRGGKFEFAIGSAGSTTLVAQTIWPALLAANAPARVRIEGGTHNPAAPPFDYLAGVFVPMLRRLGADTSVTLDRHGFAPAGGGAITLEVTPSKLGALELLTRGELRTRQARVLFSRLPFNVAEREKGELVRLGWDPASVQYAEVESNGPGNLLFATVESAQLTEAFTSFGERGVRAELVAHALAREVREYLATDVPVGPHLCDQLLLPLALGAGGTFRTLPLTQHARTQAEVIARFLGPRVRFENDPAGARVTVSA
jgi:RNA 3'-terminal phosphate cyclase (ATP)